MTSYVFGDNHDKTNINQVYTNLKSKNFSEAIVQLNSLSKENNAKAQHLYAQILYTGEITTQDFERVLKNLSGLGDDSSTSQPLNLYIGNGTWKWSYETRSPQKLKC